MNNLISIVCVASAMVFAAGCAAHSDSVALGVQAPYAGYPYDGYYDDFYGPFYDGYWGGDGFFYYSNGPDGYRRDDGNHFRHEGAGGFHGIHTGAAGLRAGVGAGFRSGSGGGRVAGGGGGRR